VNRFVADMPEAIAKLLSRDPRVEVVEQDTRGTLLTVQPDAPWGLDRIDQRDGLNSSYEYLADGSGVDVYVLDTRMRVTHEQFGGRAVWTGIDLAPPPDDGPCDFEYPDCVENPPPGFSEGNPDALCMHGTAMAALAGGSWYGVAKNVRLLSVAVANCQGTVDASLAADAIDAVIALHQQSGRPSVMNLSWRVYQNNELDDTVRDAIAAGITVVAGAGNNGNTTTDHSPQSVADVIVVGATNASDQRWVSSSQRQSNFGPALDLFAPGAGVVTAGAASDTDYNGFVGQFGTSGAAALVSGAAAMYLQRHPFDTPVQVQDALVDNASDNRVENQGVNTTKRLLYTGFITGPPPIPPIPPIPPSGGPMQSSSAVRGCSNYNELSPVYEPTANACYSRCVAYGANACEWSDSGGCYVEYGNSCTVESGYSGWSAAVLNSGGGTGGSGDMTANSGVRECQSYSEWSPVYQPDQNSCKAYCSQNGADACEWHAASGDCYVEFGNSCQIQGGFSGWYAAVLNSPGIAGPSPLPLGSSATTTSATGAASWPVPAFLLVLAAWCLAKPKIHVSAAWRPYRVALRPQR